MRSLKGLQKYETNQANAAVTRIQLIQHLMNWTALMSPLMMGAAFVLIYQLAMRGLEWYVWFFAIFWVMPIKMSRVIVSPFGLEGPGKFSLISLKS